MSNIMDRSREFVKLEARKKELKADLEKVNKELTALEAQLLEDFAADGVQKITQGERTLYLHRQIYASIRPEFKEGAPDLFEQLGLGQLVSHTIPAQTLASWVKEQEREQDVSTIGQEVDVSALFHLPPELAPAIKITECFEIRTVKAGKA